MITVKPFSRIPDYDPAALRPAHYWVVGALHVVNPDRTDAGDVLLDAETLVQVSGTVCAYCEQPFAPATHAQRCPGHPLGLGVCDQHGTPLTDRGDCPRCVQVRKQ